MNGIFKRLLKPKRDIEIVNLNIKNLDQIKKHDYVVYHYWDISINKRKITEEETFKLNPEQKQFYKDEQYKLLLDLINTSDKIILYNYSKKETAYYQKNMPFEVYRINTEEKLINLDESGCIYDIKLPETKSFLIYDFIQFQNSDKTLKNKDYIYFLFDNAIVARYSRQSGIIEDFSSFVDSYLERQKPKHYGPENVLSIKNYEQVKNHNNSIYDYLALAIKKGKLKREEKENISKKQRQIFADEQHELLKYLINNTSNIILNGYPERELDNYKKNLPYSEYILMTKKRMGNMDAEGYLFSIKDKKSKIFLLKNLKYNLEEYEEGYDGRLFVKNIDINRNYVANEEAFEHKERIFFLIENTVVANFKRRDGTLFDYTNFVDNYLNREKNASKNLKQ